MSMAEGMDMSEVNLMDMGAMFGFDDMTELQKKLMEGFLSDEQVIMKKNIPEGNECYVAVNVANRNW